MINTNMPEDAVFILASRDEIIWMITALYKGGLDHHFWVEFDRGIYVSQNGVDIISKAMVESDYDYSNKGQTPAQEGQ